MNSDTIDHKNEIRLTRRRRYRERKFAGVLTGNKRLQACGRNVSPSAEAVEVMRTAGGRSFFRGVLACRMVWLCPVCAPFEMNKRAFMLAEYASQWAEQKRGLAMLTLTFRHNKDMPLADTLAAMKAAYRRFTSGRAAVSWRASLGIEHTVSATEITNGAAGWHPHLHILLFRNWRTRITDETEAIGRALWREAGRAEAISTGHERAFDIRAGMSSVAEYLAKHGRPARNDVVREVVTGLGKHGRKANRTPAELLTDAESGDDVAAALFVEYANATRGRNLIVKSRGLMKRFGEAEVSREIDTMAGGPRERGISVITLSRTQWYRFTKAPIVDRLAVLEAVEAEKIEAALYLLHKAGVFDR